MSRQTWWMVLGAVLFLTGCDQSDPTPPEGEKPDGGHDRDGGEVDEVDGSIPDGLETRDHLYPLVPGSSWVYAHRGGSEPWDEEVELVEETRDGATVLLLRDSPGPSGSRSESIIEEDGATALRVSKEVFVGNSLQARAEYLPGFTRNDMAWAKRAAGYSETLSYARKEWDADGLLTRDGERSHMFTIEDTDASVSVPAGTFTGCLQFHRVRDRGDDSALDEADDKRFWHCPGIGKVKEVEDYTGKTEELVECDVPGGRCP